MNYKPIIGLEIHVELNTKSKMFCPCKNDPNEHIPNINVCPICMGHPGVLPVINKEAVRKVIKTGLALKCQIPEYSKFDRKNYFYPDLPKGYQISQYDMPLCQKGFLEINNKKVRITRIHLEEDTGRLIHPVRDQQGRKESERKQISNRVHEKGYSLVDFNRAGIPLMELVTEPDITSALEARKFAQELQLILRYLNVSNADMEKGQMRVEVNISLSKNQKLGTKVEIKNLNSFKVVEGAIDYEIERQTKLLKSGKKVIQETRGWSDDKKITLSQRTKEEDYDYRYFPEPDLPPLHSPQKFINTILVEIPELPQQRRKRFKKEYKLQDSEIIEVFVQNKDLGEYFEKTMSELRDWVKSEKMETRVSQKEYAKLVKLCSNYMITDLQGLLKGASVVGEDFLISPENFAEFITLIYERKISSKIAKQVLGEMFKTGADPSHIIEDKELTLIGDEKKLGEIIKKTLLKNQKAVSDYKKGKESALQFLIGQVMQDTKGRANPEIVSKILKKLYK